MCAFCLLAAISFADDAAPPPDPRFPNRPPYELIDELLADPVINQRWSGVPKPPPAEFDPAAARAELASLAYWYSGASASSPSISADGARIAFISRPRMSLSTNPDDPPGTGLWLWEKGRGLGALAPPQGVENISESDSCWLSPDGRTLVLLHCTSRTLDSGGSLRSRAKEWVYTAWAIGLENRSWWELGEAYRRPMKGRADEVAGDVAFSPDGTRVSLAMGPPPKSGSPWEPTHFRVHERGVAEPYEIYEDWDLFEPWMKRPASSVRLVASVAPESEATFRLSIGAEGVTDAERVTIDELPLALLHDPLTKETRLADDCDATPDGRYVVLAPWGRLDGAPNPWGGADVWRLDTATKKFEQISESRCLVLVGPIPDPSLGCRGDPSRSDAEPVTPDALRWLAWMDDRESLTLLRAMAKSSRLSWFDYKDGAMQGVAVFGEFAPPVAEREPLVPFSKGAIDALAAESSETRGEELMRDAFLDPTFYLTSAMLCQESERTEAGNWRFKGVFPELPYHAGPPRPSRPWPKNASWTFASGQPRDGWVAIYYSSVSGPRMGAGYVGLMKRLDDRWAIVHFAQLWVS